MIELRNRDSHDVLGIIDEEQLQFLIDHLEETETEDRDYWIDENTLEMLEEEGADPELLRILRKALGEEAEGVEVEWDRRR
ncbi:MAG: galactosyldiacylglycerol synthase [Gemmatimonadota bacterium]|jgi:hypothetical protein